MKNIYSVILFACVWVVPMVVFIGLSYVGEVHPLEGKSIPVEKLLSNSEHKIEVLFFGYSECPHVCPNSLSKVSAVLASVKKEYPSANLGGSFFDINTDSDLDRANEYSQFFSEEIKGEKLAKSELEKLKQEFALRVKQGVDNPVELFHTDYFFILKRRGQNWEIARVLANNINEDDFKKILIELV